MNKILEGEKAQLRKAFMDILNSYKTIERIYSSFDYSTIFQNLEATSSEAEEMESIRKVYCMLNFSLGSLEKMLNDTGRKDFINKLNLQFSEVYYNKTKEYQAAIEKQQQQKKETKPLSVA